MLCGLDRWLGSRRLGRRRVCVEDVGRARPLADIVVAFRPDHDGVPVDRHGDAEVVAAASEAVSLATWPYVAPPSLVRKT